MKWDCLIQIDIKESFYIYIKHERNQNLCEKRNESNY